MIPTLPIIVLDDADLDRAERYARALGTIKRRKKQDYDEENIYQGACGEIAYGRWCASRGDPGAPERIARHLDSVDQQDHRDFVRDDTSEEGRDVDVKSASWYWTERGYGNMCVKSPKSKVDYVMAQPDGPSYRRWKIVGWLPGGEVRKEGDRKKDDKGETYYRVKAKKLRDPSSF